jgi:hypothetical protein
MQEDPPRPELGWVVVEGSPGAANEPDAVGLPGDPE